MLTENSVERVTVRHHEACRVMPNSYPIDGIFNLHLTTIMDYLFLHTLPSTIAFRHEYVLFYRVYAKITTFFNQEKFGTATLLYVDVEMFGRNGCENDVKIVILTSCRRVFLHPPCKTFPSPCRVHRNPSWVSKEVFFSIGIYFQDTLCTLITS